MSQKADKLAWEWINPLIHQITDKLTSEVFAILREQGIPFPALNRHSSQNDQTGRQTSPKTRLRWERSVVNGPSSSVVITQGRICAIISRAFAIASSEPARPVSSASTGKATPTADLPASTLSSDERHDEAEAGRHTTASNSSRIFCQSSRLPSPSLT